MNNLLINTGNLLDIIDNTVLEFKDLRLGGILSAKGKTQILSVLDFLKNVTGDDYKRLLHSKAFFIEEKPLEDLHSEMKNINIEKNNIEQLINMINTPTKIAGNDITYIQHMLIEVSMPIWKITKQKSS